MVDIPVRTPYKSTPEERIDLENKLSRLREGQPLRVVDLFSGCGGMSLGLHRAGYQLLGGVEINARAIETHTNNFFRGSDKETFARHNTPRDIQKFTPDMFMREILQRTSPENLVDIIVGGPPCQAFARIGRAKLRHVRQDPTAHLTDTRASLYIPYLQYVEFFRPLAVIMENVPDIMNHGGKNVAEEIAKTLEEIGYRCHYTILNTAHYGVPQMRQRFYLVALLNDLNANPDPVSYFPAPTHFIEIPPGYLQARSAATSLLPRKLQQTKLFDGVSTNETFINEVPTRYVHLPDPSKDLPTAITVRDALEDLPEIRLHLHAETARGGVRRFDNLAPYREDIKLSAYAKDMRIWRDFSSHEGVLDHVIRYLPRDYGTFKRMQPGDEYPRAHEIAKERFEEELRAIELETGRLIAKDSEEYYALQKRFVPPYNSHKFPNKWWKLIPGQPSRTLTAHMGKDTYSHIHYDREQARVISVREAARLQSFPDGFKFSGAMNAAYTQIGNAVSPLQAYKFGMHVRQILENAAEQTVYEIPVPVPLQLQPR
jgi:DNA (cytosine-5)-methyltransferase 1